MTVCFLCTAELPLRYQRVKLLVNMQDNMSNPEDNEDAEVWIVMQNWLS